MEGTIDIKCTKNSARIGVESGKDSLCVCCRSFGSNSDSIMGSSRDSDSRSQAFRVVSISKSEDKKIKCGDHNICLSGKLRKKSEHLGFWNERFFTFKLCRENGLLLFYWKNAKNSLPEQRNGLYVPFPHRCGSSLEDIPPRGAFAMNECIPEFNSNLDAWDVEFSIKNVYKVATKMLQNECCRENDNEAVRLNREPMTVHVKANSGQTATCWYTSFLFTRALSYRDDNGYQLISPLLESKLCCHLFSSSTSTISTENESMMYDDCTYFAVYLTTLNQSEQLDGKKAKKSRTLLVGWKDFNRRKHQLTIPKLFYDLTESTFEYDDTNNSLVIIGANNAISTGEKKKMKLTCMCSTNSKTNHVCMFTKETCACIISKWLDILAPETRNKPGSLHISSVESNLSSINCYNKSLNDEAIETVKKSEDGMKMKRNIDFSTEIRETKNSDSKDDNDFFVDELILNGNQFEQLSGDDIMVDEMSLEYSYSSSLSSNMGDEEAEDEGFMDLTEWLDKQTQFDKENFNSSNHMNNDSGKSPKSPVRTRLLKQDILRREPWQSPRSVKLSPINELELD
mmetsp:Transcript_9305/g.10784  ORF Transcript_9305/g.10784 Transcript_9305/m.10784 type:complete len:569 (-) Transcript_9305:210-1916(-)